MSILDRAFSRIIKAASRSFSLVTVMIPTWEAGQPSYPDHRFPTYVSDGYRKNEIIYACVEATADTAASTRLMVMRRGDDQEMEDHPLRALMERPNPFMSEFDFWSMTLIYYKLAGAAYWIKRRNNLGQVIELWPLRPDYVAPIRDGKAFISQYEYNLPGNDQVKLDAADVLAFVKRDPLDLYKILSPLKVLSRSADVDNEITDYLKRFFEKGGNPAGVLKSKLKLSPQSIDQILASWEKRYGGVQNWYKPTVLDSDAEYQRTGLTFQEMGFTDLDQRNELRICQVLRVPPIIVGTRGGLARSTFSNYGEARKAWWEDTLLPLYKYLSDTIDAQLAPDFGDDIDTEWDFSEVPALKDNRDAQWTRATTAWQAGMITLNMALKEIGLEQIGDSGDVFMRPSTVQMIDMDGIEVSTEDPDAVKPEPPEPVIPAANPNPETMPGAGDALGGQAALPEGQQPASKPEGKAVATIHGEPLPPNEATDVPDFKPGEIDALFALYEQLVGK